MGYCENLLGKYGNAECDLRLSYQIHWPNWSVTVFQKENTLFLFCSLFQTFVNFYLVPILWVFALCPLPILCFVGVVSDFLCVSGSVHRYWSSARPPVHPSDWLSQWPLQQQLWQTPAFHLAAVFGSPSGSVHHSPRWCTGSTPCLGWAHPPGRISLYCL